MLVDVPYPVAKAFEGGGWLLVPGDALLDYARVERSTGHGTRAESLLMLLLSRAERDDGGRLVVEFEGRRLAAELGIKYNALGTRLHTLSEKGEVRCIKKGYSNPECMEKPSRSVWEILPGWAGSVLTEATAGRDVLVFEDEDEPEDSESGEEEGGTDEEL